MNKLIYLSLICILLSCLKEDIAYTPAYENYAYSYGYVFKTNITKNGLDANKQVKYIYGYGKPNDSIFLSQYRRQFNEFDTVFQLPFNISKDTSIYCLERVDGKKDTIEITYNRIYNAMYNNSIYMAARNIKISKVSTGILLDSCQVSSRSDVSENAYRAHKLELKIELK